MKPRISMISLGVKDLALALKFYEQGLGLPRKTLDPETDAAIAFFPLSGTWLCLYPRHELAADAGLPSEGWGFENFALAHNVSSREEVDQVLRQAEAAAGTLVKPAQDTFWGGYSGYFSDPDGHLWEVAWNPLFWVGPEDTAA